MRSAEYTNSLLSERLKNARITIGILLCFCLILPITSGIITYEASAEEKNRWTEFTEQFGEEKRIIACWSDTRRKVIDTKKGGCFFERRLKNITLPQKRDIKIWWGVAHGNQRKIINQIALVNFESNFNIHADSGIAKGYVQILKKTSNKYRIPNTVYSQLKWLQNDQDKHKNNICSNKVGEVGISNCLSCRHLGCGQRDWRGTYRSCRKWNHGATKCLSFYKYMEDHWYVYRYQESRKFYYKYLNEYDLNGNIINGSKIGENLFTP